MDSSLVFEANLGSWKKMNTSKGQEAGVNGKVPCPVVLTRLMSSQHNPGGLLTARPFGSQEV